jgi:hypothetical protein
VILELMISATIEENLNLVSDQHTKYLKELIKIKNKLKVI